MTSAELSNLTERMYIFIEDRNYKKAVEYAERILDIDSKNANAYLGKLLVDCRLTKISELAKITTDYTNNINYQRCIKYGDEQLINTLEQLLKDKIIFIKERQAQKNNKREKAKTAVKTIVKISSPFLAVIICIVLIINLVIVPSKKYNRAENLYSSKLYQQALEIYQTIPFWKDSVDKANSCNMLIPYQNYITYKTITVKFPRSIEYDVEVKDNKIYLYGSIRAIPSINTFLSYLVPPNKRLFYDRKDIDNGCAAFIIENHAMSNSQMLDLEFLQKKESKQYVARYINQHQNYINGYESDTVFFKGETIIKGQYCDMTKFYRTYFTITVVVEYC